MQVRVLGGYGGLCPGRLLTSFLIDSQLTMDAGSLAASLDIAEQGLIRHILVTHSHLDHTGTLPFFADNIFGVNTQPVSILGIPETIKSLKANLFNNDIWPDFSVLPNLASPTIVFAELDDETPTRVGDYTVTAVRVNHTVPAVGFIIDRGDTSILFTGDTAETDRLWEVAAGQANLRAAFIETSFPNRLQNIADLSGHLTPRTLKGELGKLDRDLPVYVYHIKPRFYAEIESELAALGRPQLRIVEQGKTYGFGPEPPA